MTIDWKKRLTHEYWKLKTFGFLEFAENQNVKNVIQVFMGKLTWEGTLRLIIQGHSKVIYVMRGLIKDCERIQRFRCNICDKDFPVKGTMEKHRKS